VPLGVEDADAERRQQLVTGEREEIDVQRIDIDEGRWCELRSVDQEVRAGAPVRLDVAARRCERF
jgi:hypothetical protein